MKSGSKRGIRKQFSKDDETSEERGILGNGRPNFPSTPPRQRKRTQVFEPLVVLQRPSLNSDELGRQLDTNDMVDHLVNTLGLIGVSPSLSRRPRPSRISLQHDSNFKINELT